MKVNNIFVAAEDLQFIEFQIYGVFFFLPSESPTVYIQWLKDATVLKKNE